MQTSAGLWRRTPPAIFPSILGLFGLGLAWRRAGEVFGVPDWLGEILLALVSALFLIGVVAYLGKFLRRPAALLDDLSNMLGRAGISAGSMAAMLMAAALVPYSICAAKIVLAIGLAMHQITVVLVLRILWKLPLAQRRMTPEWHLIFVGVIVAPIAAVPVGWLGLADVIFFMSIAVATTIWTGNLFELATRPVPPALRPTLAIHLAPVALLGVAAALLGYGPAALIFGLSGMALSLCLLARTGYLTAAGFSPFWGSFTFPLAAFCTLMLVLAQAHGGAFQVLAWLGLIGATVAIPPISYRIVNMWQSGSLAVQTDASHV